MLLRLYPNAPGAARFDVVNGATPTGYVVLNSIDWGNAAWDHAFSGPRGTQGARPSNGVPQQRVVTIPVKIDPQGSVDAFHARQSVLFDVLDDMRRFGGKILVQITGQTNRQWLEVMTLGVARADWGRKGAIVDTGELDIVAQCAPYMLGDPMDTLDAFAIDSSADYTASTGTSGSIAVAADAMTPSSTGLKVFRHTGKGYAFGDVQVTLDLTTAGTVTSGVWGAALCMDTAGADTEIVAELVAGTNVVAIAKYVAGTRTSLATVASTPLASTRYWVRNRREGNVIIAELFTTAPTPVSTPAATVSYTLTAAEAGRFVTGHAGFRWTPASTSEKINELDIEPYTYRLVNMPEQVRLGGAVPGDVPALADISVTPLGGAATPIWGTVGWLERSQVTNLCWNGDLESSVIGTGGWSVASIGALGAAATSVARDTTAARTKYGAANLQIVCPATTDTGANFVLAARFKRGRTYAAFVWASSASQTTAARIKLGAVTDFATGTAAALSATAKLYSVVWTPTADSFAVALVFGINAATATTMNIDGACVVEVPSITLSAGINASVTTATVYGLPAEIPNLQPDGSLSAPFLAMIDQEMIRVTAASLATGAITFDRAAEGSTAASHSADANVILCPPSRPQLEGKGATPPFGVIDLENWVTALSSVTGGTLASASDTNARNGLVLRWTPSTSGAQTGTIINFIDPSALVPDDYTQGEVDVEVWIREAWTTSLTNLRVTLSAQPEGGSTAGPERFTREYGNVGKLIQPAGAKVARIHRLGTLPLVVDPANPQRWRLKLGLACTGGSSPTWDMDYLLLLPTRARTPWPTGKANDTASAATFPAFVPYDSGWTTTSAMTKRLRSDGSSIVSIPGGYGYPDQGPGKPIEIPDVACDMIVKLSPLVPDDPTLDSTAEAVASITTSLHAAITPRYALGRAT